MTHKISKLKRTHLALNVDGAVFLDVRFLEVAVTVIFVGVVDHNRHRCTEELVNLRQ